MTNYNGLIIGPVMDGYYQSSLQPFFDAVHQPELRWGRATWGTQIFDQPKTETYVFVQSWFDSRGFWIPRSVAETGVAEAQKYIMDKLIEAYEQRANQNGVV